MFVTIDRFGASRVTTRVAAALVVVAFALAIIAIAWLTGTDAIEPTAVAMSSGAAPAPAPASPTRGELLIAQIADTIARALRTLEREASSAFAGLAIAR